MSVNTLIKAINTYRSHNPDARKQSVAAAIASQLNLTKHRSVFSSKNYVVRFSEASGNSFSNVVLSLSALRPFDDKPVVVAVLRAGVTDFLLANTTFLKKISHSSQELQIDSIRGSFLGHDIMRRIEEIENVPENFELLFSMHQEFTWEENLQRLVNATQNIVGTGKRFEPTGNELANILLSPALANRLAMSYQYNQLKTELSRTVAANAPEILKLATIDNVNVRGNRIEQLLTGGKNEHRLADIVRESEGIDVSLENKTKLMDRASSPKVYNIDKALSVLGRGNTAIAFCFVGISLRSEMVTSATISIFDKTILAATRVQFHWAGRNSRGVTQLTGNFTTVFAEGYIETIDENAARSFLHNLLSR